MYGIFLDDLRDIPALLDLQFPTLLGIQLARSSKEFRDLVRELGAPEVISFDHDLGEVDGVVQDSMEAMRWLIDVHLDGAIDLNLVKAVIVHSANPAGSKNLISLWDSFSSNVLESGVTAIYRPS